MKVESDKGVERYESKTGKCEGGELQTNRARDKAKWNAGSEEREFD